MVGEYVVWRAPSCALCHYSPQKLIKHAGVISASNIRGVLVDSMPAVSFLRADDASFVDQ